MKKQISLSLMVFLILSALCVTAIADRLPPTLEIVEVTFSKVLYAGQIRTLSIDIKNTGLGDAHDLTVELSSDLQGLSFPPSTKLPTIPKGKTRISNIPVQGEKKLSNNDKAWISIRLIDKGHNQEFPYDRPQICKFKTRELELVLNQVKFKNVSRPDKPIRRNDVINLKFYVKNKSGVTAEKVKIKVDNNQGGVKWLGVEIGNEIEIINRGESLLKEHPTFAMINPGTYKVINYIYHLDRDFNDSEVRFTISGTVESEKDHWVKEEYENRVIIPFSWLRIVGWVGSATILVIIIGVAGSRVARFRWARLIVLHLHRIGYWFYDAITLILMTIFVSFITIVLFIIFSIILFIILVSGFNIEREIALGIAVVVSIIIIFCAARSGEKSKDN